MGRFQLLSFLRVTLSPFSSSNHELKIGNSESNERQPFIGVIMQPLYHREIKVKKTQCSVLYYVCPRAMSMVPRRGQCKPRNMGKGEKTTKSLLYPAWP